MEERALLAFLVALALTTAATPLVARIARRVGALDPVKERGLASEPTPLLGGLAIFAGVLVAGAIFLPAIDGDARDPRRRGADHARRADRRPARHLARA